MGCNAIPPPAPSQQIALWGVTRSSFGEAARGHERIPSKVGPYPITADPLPGYHRSMPLGTVVVTLIIVGLLLWVINTYIPMDGKIKQILNIVVVIAVIL